MTESRVDGVATGERVYSFLPMATHLIMQPVNCTADGFSDGTAHCLSQRNGRAHRIIGLTSSANAAFARSLGCYDSVLDYGGCGKLKLRRTHQLCSRPCKSPPARMNTCSAG